MGVSVKQSKQKVTNLSPLSKLAGNLPGVSNHLKKIKMISQVHHRWHQVDLWPDNSKDKCGPYDFVLETHYTPPVLITKTCLYNVYPLKPHFYIVKVGFTGVYIIFLVSAQEHWLWVLVLVPTIYVLSRNMKNIRVFYLKISSFKRWNFLYICIGVFS